MLSRISSLLRCDLAIDLGTASTRVALPGEGVVLDEPSVVAIARGASRVLPGGCSVGHLAHQMSGRTPESVQVVRPLSAGVVTDMQLCRTMLRYFLCNARPSGCRVRPRLLLAAPRSLTPVEKRALYASAHAAGARQVLLVPVAHAAALGVGLPIAEPLASMVIDIGAGLTEVAVLSLGDVVAAQSIRIGGEQMDQAIVDWLRRKHGVRAGLSMAEQLRVDLGCEAVDEEAGSAEICCLDSSTGVPRRIEVASADIRSTLAEPLGRIVDAVRATLDQCTPELVSDVASRGVVLCGGGSLLRGFDRWIVGRIGIPARVAPNARTAVVEGALLCLEHLEVWRTLVESSHDAA